MVGILNNSETHHLQNYFYHENYSSKTFGFSLFCLVLLLILFFLLMLQVLLKVFTRLKILDLSTKPFFHICIKYLSRKFMIIKSNKLFSFNLWCFCIINCFCGEITDVLSILFSTTFRALLVAKPVMVGVFLPSQ